MYSIFVLYDIVRMEYISAGYPFIYLSIYPIYIPLKGGSQNKAIRV